MTPTPTSGAADLLAMVSKALREAYNLGQRYWQQADSEYISQHKKADDTRAKFLALVEETCAALAAAPQPSPTAPATQQPEGDVVAYLDVGAGGYLDLGSELSEDALQQLPKGRHALVIAGTYGIDGYVAAPQPSTMAQAAESVPAIQGEMNVQLDIDSNHSAPGQQRDMACSLALGQPAGNGSDQVAGHPSAQEDKLLTVAERNIRSFLRSATFKSESDREAALNCVDVLWEAARATAESVQEEAARYRWLREGNDAKHGAAWHVAVNLYGFEWDAAIDAARKQGERQ